MNTPIADFVRDYQALNAARLHMPGHKGKGFLGPEALDITEIKGADALYEADGIIARSEENASQLLGSGKTLYSTEGSSQCIRAMLYLVMMAGKSRTVVAARNVHKAFVYAAALLDLDVVWLWPDEGTDSLCSCKISAASLERTLGSLSHPPAAVYLTSPDYLGGQSDIKAMADVCHRYGTVLAVDNAHGAYLHYLPEPVHPLDLGADICCDSAHKTLPVLTGGAYLHISKNASSLFALDARSAMGIFGSTSPSYLTLASLDLCNDYLDNGYREKLAHTVQTINNFKSDLRGCGWTVEESDPLKITIKAPANTTGTELAERLRDNGVEPEYADPDYLVLMATVENSEDDFKRVSSALGVNESPVRKAEKLPLPAGRQMMSIRQAMFMAQEAVSVEQALGRICAAPAVSCPPAIPIAISGEQITEEAIEIFRYYDIHDLSVIK